MLARPAVTSDFRVRTHRHKIVKWAPYNTSYCEHYHGNQKMTKKYINTVAKIFIYNIMKSLEPAVLYFCTYLRLTSLFTEQKIIQTAADTCEYSYIRHKFFLIYYYRRRHGGIYQTKHVKCYKLAACYQPYSLTILLPSNLTLPTLPPANPTPCQPYYPTRSIFCHPYSLSTLLPASSTPYQPYLPTFCQTYSLPTLLPANPIPCHRYSLPALQTTKPAPY